MSPKSKVRSSRLPFVSINMAMTVDGKIATANRAVTTFGSPRDHEHLLTLRATADAVMAGARTVDSAAINLGPGPARFRRLRVKNGLKEYNLRIIVSGSGSLDLKAEIFKHRFSPIIILTTGRASRTKLGQLRAIADEVMVFGRHEINFRAALHHLHRRWSVRHLLCEGGGELNDALFRSGLVDELHLTICPQIIGGRKAPTIADGRGLLRLTAAMPLQLKSFKRLKNEVFAVFRRVPKR